MKKSFVFFVCITITFAVFSQKEEIDALHNQAYAFFKTDLDSALIVTLKSKELARAGDYPLLIAQSLFIEAYIYSRRDEMGKSFIVNLEALETLEPENDPDHLKLYLKILLNTGEILERHSAFEMSLEYYNEGIMLATGKPDFQKSLMKLHFNKAIAQQLNKDLVGARVSVNVAHDLAIELHDEMRIIRYLNRKGLILTDAKDYDQARLIFKAIIEYPFKEVSPARALAQAWHNLGHIDMLDKNPQSAEHSYLEALNWREQDGDPKGEFETLVDLTEVYIAQNKFYEADSVGQKAVALYSKQAVLPENYRIYDLMAQCAYKNAHYEIYYDLSRSYYKENEKFLAIQSELMRTKDTYKMEILTAGFFTSKSNDHGVSLLNTFILIALLVFGFIALIYYQKIRVKIALENDLIKIELES